MPVGCGDTVTGIAMSGVILRYCDPVYTTPLTKRAMENGNRPHVIEPIEIA